jgi:methionyl-tRNA formyltransferase
LPEEQPASIIGAWPPSSPGHQLLDGAPDHLGICVVPEMERLVRLLRAYEPDLCLCLCLGYRWLLTQEVLAIPPLGIVNGHPSLLPRWGGPGGSASCRRESAAR